MGGSSGGGKSTSNTKPWKKQRPYLEDLFGSAQGLYESGVGQSYYPGETVAGFSDPTTQGMNMLYDRGMQGSNQQNALGDYISGSLGQGQIDPRAIAAGGFGAMSGIGEGQNMLSEAGNPMDYGQAAWQAGVSRGTDDSGLAGTAQGGFLGSNPYLDDVYNNAAQNVTEQFNEGVMPGLNATFGSGGRTGSGIHALMAGRAGGDAAKELRGLAGDIYAPAYESERDRMVDAGNMWQSGDIARRGMASDIYSGDRDRQLSAGMGLGEIGMGGMGGLSDIYGNISSDMYRAGTMAPSFRDMEYGDINQVMGVGGMVDEQTQRLMDADKAKYDFNQQAPWSALNNYASAIYGLPGGFGNTTSQQPGGSRIMGGLGGAMGGAGLAGAFPALSPYAVPMAIGGGILGAF